MECPGQDTRFWKQDDVFEIECPQCHYHVEFFKYDVKRKCRCGHEMVNPKIDFGCAQWCSYGDKCLESLPEDVRAVQKDEQNKRLRERILHEVKKHFGQDANRLNHALRVAKYAEEVLKIEGGHPLVVLGAAYLHGVGVKEANEKHGNSSLEDVEREGAAAAREILKKLNIQREIYDEICDIIAHHGHPREAETLHFQIFYEADRLAAIEEGLFREQEGDIIGKAIQTATGKKLAQELFRRSGHGTEKGGIQLQI